MPVKNAGPYLKPCLDSIIKQTYTNWELIAVNDGSTDGSAQLLANYATKSQKIKFFNNTGQGIVDALSTAYDHSEGEWIHRMDADDLMPVNKLQSMRHVAEPGKVVTGKVMYFCDEYELGQGFVKYAKWINALMDGGDFWRDVYRECNVPSAAWLLHRSDFDRIGGFHSSLMPEDYDLCFRMLQHQLEVIRLDVVLHYWRDSAARTSRHLTYYFPVAYVPLKVHYFLQLHRDVNKTLILWGTGKKGKLIAKEFLLHNVGFTWITSNINKVGKDIYGVKVELDNVMDLDNSQIAIAFSSPKDQQDTRKLLEKLGKVNNRDYFYFF